MKNIWKYLLIGLAALLLIFLIGIPFLGWAFAPAYRMGPWMMGPYGGFGHMGSFGMLGGLMFLGMLGIPLLLIIGAVALVISLARGGNTGAGPVNMVGTHPCPNCGKYVQNDWAACPYCGQKLKE